MYVSICFKGHLDPSWQSWLENLQIRHVSDGTTMLIGTLPDQPALYGVLNKLNQLNLSLLFLESSDKAETKEDEFPMTTRWLLTEHSDESGESMRKNVITQVEGEIR